MDASESEIESGLAQLLPENVSDIVGVPDTCLAAPPQFASVPAGVAPPSVGVAPSPAGVAPPPVGVAALVTFSRLAGRVAAAVTPRVLVSLQDQVSVAFITPTI